MQENSTDSDKNDNLAPFARVEAIDEETANILLDGGMTDLETIKESGVDKLEQLLEDGEKASVIYEQVKAVLEGDQVDTGGNDEELASWLRGDSDAELGGLLGKEIEKAKKDGVTVKNETVVEDDEDYGALKAWLTGDADSFDDWLGQESFEDEKEQLHEEIAEKEEGLQKAKKELETKQEALDRMREQLEIYLGEMEGGDFDPQKIIDENMELRNQVSEMESHISDLKREKEELINDVMEIKQGSVAMLKYLKAQKGSVGPGASSEEVEKLQKENSELKDRIHAMESSADYEGMSDDIIKQKLISREREISEKNKRIEDLMHDLKFKEEEFNELKERMKFKEHEFNDREQDLMMREEVMKKQLLEFESLKQEFGGTTEKERKRHLENLEKEISAKEHELKAKEQYIQQKERELRSREEDLIDEELEDRKEEIMMEIQQEKAKTGTTRLDDLTMGGIPLGSNVSLYGPPHCGKRVLINSFVGEGLEKGVPAIWVSTDKTVDDIREEMKFVLPTYLEYEKRGLVYYVDGYSMSMGEDVDPENPPENTIYIDGQSNIDAITDAVEKFAGEIMEKHRYYRLAFVSISTIIAYLDTSTTFRALQPFAGRRKKDRAVAMYTLEKGMHSQQDISMLGHMMDGEIEFKFQQLNTFLKVGGLGDVQTRDWVRYTSSKSGITMGSFSLDTIR